MLRWRHCSTTVLKLLLMLWQHGEGAGIYGCQGWEQRKRYKPQIESHFRILHPHIQATHCYNHFQSGLSASIIDIGFPAQPPPLPSEETYSTYPYTITYHKSAPNTSTSCNSSFSPWWLSSPPLLQQITMPQAPAAISPLAQAVSHQLWPPFKVLPRPPPNSRARR